MSVGKNIAKLRVKKGKTQERLSEEIGVSVPTLARWERGVSQPRASDIKTLCEALGATETELLNGLVNGVMFEATTGGNDIFGVFSVPRNIDVEKAGLLFVNHLRAELAGDEARRGKLAELEG